MARVVFRAFQAGSSAERVASRRVARGLHRGDEMSREIALTSALTNPSGSRAAKPRSINIFAAVISTRVYLEDGVSYPRESSFFRRFGGRRIEKQSTTHNGVLCLVSDSLRSGSSGRRNVRNGRSFMVSSRWDGIRRERFRRPGTESRGDVQPTRSVSSLETRSLNHTRRPGILGYASSPA